MIWAAFLLALSVVVVLGDNVTEHRFLSEKGVRALYSFPTADALKALLANHSDYKNRFPFPHMYADGLFPRQILMAASREIPDNPTLKADGCVEGSAACFQDKTYEFRKNAFDNDKSQGPATIALFSFLKSSRFINFLEDLTGIKDIIPDPHFVGSGIHQTLSGGYLNLHADFNRYPRYNLHRRVNVFIFLNPDWKDEYGGHLELWNRDMKFCGAMIRPLLGRLAVFSSTDFSYHGHPVPLATPPTRSRRSLALYYYTTSRPTEECIDNNCDSSHSTLWQKPPCSSCEDKKCRKFDSII